MVVEELRDFKLLVLNIFLVLYLIMLSFLTFNLALLQYTFFVHVLYEGTNFVSERLQRILSEIIQIDKLFELVEKDKSKYKVILGDFDCDSICSPTNDKQLVSHKSFFRCIWNLLMLWSKVVTKKVRPKY